MTRKLLTLLRGSLLAGIISAAFLTSCENERPDFHFILPDPEVEYIYMESLTPDTVRFRMRDSIVFNVRTTPYNLFAKDSISLEVSDMNGEPYRFISISKPRLRADSIWDISGYPCRGISNGDIVTLKVTGRDTVLYSDPVVLNRLPGEPIALTTLTPDTLVFREGRAALLEFRTTPVKLLRTRGVVLELADTLGQTYPYADFYYMNLADSIWAVDTYFRFGMRTGDVVSIKISDTLEDVSVTGRPFVLKMIPKPEPVYYAVEMVSDSISAYMVDNPVTQVRLRTWPWHAFLNDTLFSLSLTDTLGAAMDDIVKINSMEFEPKDSCWNVEIKILNTQKTDVFALARMQTPDSAVTSGKKILLKKVTFSLKTVKANGCSASVNTKTNTCNIIVPTKTDFNNTQITIVSHDGDKVEYDGLTLIKGKAYTVDATKPISVTLWKYNLHKDYTITVRNTGLPIVRITTNGKSVTRRDTWVEGMNMTIEMPDGTVNYSGSLSMKGRGNGTWTETNKKPYAIRLDEKAKILGMHKQKRWILLANYKDRTLLRNDAALWLSRHSGLPYTVSGQFVELEWNGTHKGNYYLCEQARIDNHRIDITNPDLNDPKSGGFFMEIDAFLDYTSSDSQDKSKELGFWSTGASSRYNLPYIFKDPDEDENGIMLTKNSASFKYMKDYVTKMENAIYNASSTNHEWQKYLNMDMAIDFALIQEITMNHDSYNTWPKPGPHSAFLYKDAYGSADSTICFGPVWDFDYHTFTLYGEGTSSSPSGENSRLKQWEILKMDYKNGNSNKYYFSDLVKRDPQFKARLVERWNMHKDTWKQQLPAYIDMMADSIRLSESCNRQLWPQGGSVNGSNNNSLRQNGDFYMTFQGAVNAMKEAFLKRWKFIDDNIGSL